MCNDQRQFLIMLGHPLGRMNVEQAAWTLNFQVHDIPILIADGLLKPLGWPPRSGTKYFATAEILRLANDVKWLAKATDAIHRHWRRKNENKKPRRPMDDGESDAEASAGE